jgi:hypothetical protein
MQQLSRRAMIAGTGALGTGLATGAAGAGPAGDVPGLEFAFEEYVTLEPSVEVGPTPYGVRHRIAITGGTFEGPRIKGRVLPGGADWQLQRADDWTVLEADYMIEADDGARIHVRNIGLTNSRVAGAADRYLRTAPVFEAPRGRHEWLNQSLFLGTVIPVAGGGAVRIRIYRVS